MKKLSDEELNNFSLDKAEEICNDFGKFMKDYHSPMFGWEDDLPWAKSDILLALLSLLKLVTDNERKETLAYGIIYLNGFLPKEKEYKRRCAVIEKISSVGKDLKSGLSNDEIISKYNRKK